ncbi:MAG TPA: cupin domain-containing protein [Alphaproteobacteria bacterium]|nr:cupin domain-containing protein [Alphaproteobacteria bacterium]
MHKGKPMDAAAPAAARLRRFQNYRWEATDRLPYKEEGSAPFKAISRQVLFAGADFGCELRYFEMEAGGYSSLERHEHTHAVMIFRGRGHCLIGDTVQNVGTYDLITIPAWTWHQFRATAGEPLGFLCMVNAMRDKPQLPSNEDLRELKSHPEVAAFLSGA